MQFSELKLFSGITLFWRSGHELYWHELIWEVLSGNQACSNQDDFLDDMVYIINNITIMFI